MTSLVIHQFASIASQIIGDLDVVAFDAKPHPWFCKDIFRKRDLQWSGYIGPISNQEHALVFGLNLEFTPAWRRACPKIRSNMQYFSNLLCKHKDLEWHWWGRPGVIARNPPAKVLSSPKWTYQVDFDQWMSELKNILDRKITWSSTSPMRPQFQVVRYIGKPSQIGDGSLVMRNIQQTVTDLQPLVDFFWK